MANRRLREPKKKSARLLKLEEQEKALQREKEEEIKRLNDEERNKDTRRKILIGQAVMKEAVRQETIKKWVYTLLDKDLRQQYNRDVFDDLMDAWGLPHLPPLSPLDNAQAQAQAPAPASETRPQ